MSKKLTACDECLFHRQAWLTDFCVVDEEDVFDFHTGRTAKKSDLNACAQIPVDVVSCGTKNTGYCPDFKPITGKGE